MASCTSRRAVDDAPIDGLAGAVWPRHAQRHRYRFIVRESVQMAGIEPERLAPSERRRQHGAAEDERQRGAHRAVHGLDEADEERPASG